MSAGAGSHPTAVSEDGGAFLKEVGFGEKFSSLEIQLFFLCCACMTCVMSPLSFALIAANVSREWVRK